jgi:hypothetical protein
VLVEVEIEVEVEGCGIYVVAHKNVRVLVDEPVSLDDFGALGGRKRVIDELVELAELAVLVGLVELNGLELEFELELELDENDYTEVAVAVERFP